MAVSSNLTTVALLATALQLDLEPDDSYALLMIAAASNAVRDEARQPGWVVAETGDTLETDQSLAPATARDIALWVALRAYTNPGNLARKTAGPVSASFWENGVYGLGLTEDEKERLARLRPGGTGGGLWVQPVYSGTRGYRHLHVPSDMEVPGAPLYIADVGQWPYDTEV